MDLWAAKKAQVEEAAQGEATQGEAARELEAALMRAQRSPRSLASCRVGSSE